MWLPLLHRIIFQKQHTYQYQTEARKSEESVQISLQAPNTPYGHASMDNISLYNFRPV